MSYLGSMIVHPDSKDGQKDRFLSSLSRSSRLFRYIIHQADPSEGGGHGLGAV